MNLRTKEREEIVSERSSSINLPFLSKLNSSLPFYLSHLAVWIAVVVDEARGAEKPAIAALATGPHHVDIAVF
jgi:hypothetical protein